MHEQSLLLKKLAFRFTREKPFYKRLIWLGLPIALQNLIASSLNMLDTLMIGQLGETAIAGVALSNQIFFLFMLLLFGISSGTAVFTAQYWGKKDITGVHQAMGIALLFGVIGAGLFTTAALAFPSLLLRIFTRDTAVVTAAVPYLRITGISYLFTAGTIILQGVMRSTGVVKLPLYLSAGALSLNAFFNFALIFGRFGLPRLGITGAALATTGARILEVVVLVIIIYATRSPLAVRFRNLTGQTSQFIKRYLGKVYPVILNEVGWSMGITMFTLVFARMGTSVLAAYNITETFSRLMFVLFFGSANASAIVLGNMIGEGFQREANRHARFMMIAVPATSALFSLLILVLSPWIPLAFNVSEEVRVLIKGLMRILAVMMFVRVSNMHIIIGVLRSGGDTHYCMTIEIIPLWLITIPLVAFCGLVLHFPPLLTYAVSMTEEFIKYILGLRRIFSGKWIHDLTV